jgi:DNA-binding transcriptional LysR family regulator
LEHEIGVDLLRRSPRGVTLTPEGKLFLEEVRDLLKRTGESVEKVRALAGDEYSELHVDYMSTPTVEILPPALAGFRKFLPQAEVLLYDLSSNELVTGLRNATLELAIMVQPIGEQAAGIDFETLRTYPWCVAVTPAHPFARLKTIPWRRSLPNHSSDFAAEIFPSTTITSTEFSLPSAPNHASQWNATVVIRSSLKWKPGAASHCPCRFSSS